MGPAGPRGTSAAWPCPGSQDSILPSSQMPSTLEEEGVAVECIWGSVGDGGQGGGERPQLSYRPRLDSDFGQPVWTHTQSRDTLGHFPLLFGVSLHRNMRPCYPTPRCLWHPHNWYPVPEESPLKSPI